MRWNMVRMLLERMGLAGPRRCDLRAQINDMARTIEVKSDSIIAKREERKRQQTVEIQPPVPNGTH